MSLSILSVYNGVFWKGCLPGSQGNLCKVCMGGTGEAATKRCADNHNERYYGNMGALRYSMCSGVRQWVQVCCRTVDELLKKHSCNVRIYS